VAVLFLGRFRPTVDVGRYSQHPCRCSLAWCAVISVFDERSVVDIAQEDENHRCFPLKDRLVGLLGVAFTTAVLHRFAAPTKPYISVSIVRFACLTENVPVSSSLKITLGFSRFWPLVCFGRLPAV
jgi:hypothetical protein